MPDMSVEDIMRRMAESVRRVEIDEHLALGIREVRIALVTVAGGGLPPTVHDGSFRITDDEIREWEMRTGKRWTP